MTDTDEVVQEVAPVGFANDEAGVKQRSARRLEQRNFPRRTLQDALKVAEEIKANNAGRAWPAEHVAKAVDIAARSSNFQMLVAASRDYGLTTGNNRSYIAITDLGRQIIYAESEDSEKKSKKEAFFKIELFKNIFDYYNGSNLPETRFVANVLVDKFRVLEEYHEEALSIFRENCSYIGIDVSAPDPRADSRPKDLARREQAEEIAPKIGELTAFVVMPFVEKGDRRAIGFFSEVLRSLITPAAIEAGFSVKTANRQGSDLIQSTIINELLDSDLVIADLTDHNPNVMFELGLRVGDNKRPIAIIKSNDTGRLFDVDNMMRVFDYNPNLWQSTLEKDISELSKHILAPWEGRSKVRSYIQILRHQANQ